MGMRCPNCGADNPDFARYCGSCAKLLIAEPVAGPRPLMSSPLAMATLALTVALILTCIGFGLYVYMVEDLALGHSYYEEYYRVSKAMQYSFGLGNFAAVLGMAFIVQAFIAYQPRANLLAWVPQARLTLIKWMIILAAILYAVHVSTIITVNELNVGLGSGITRRLASYAPMVAQIIVVVALTVFAFELRMKGRASSQLPNRSQILTG